MLSVADDLSPTPNSPLRPAVLRLAVVILYTAGLRIGELVRLQLGDVDERTGVLHIRESKFHKSRLTPLSNDARRELRQYLRLRLVKPYDLRPAASLLYHDQQSRTRGWGVYSVIGLQVAIRRLFDRAAVRDTEGRRPRVHDVRHSFAHQVLLRAYRSGADVQTLLPKLALYMGHVNIVSTAYYLRFIPEVVALANRRFGESYSHLINTGDT
jgi:integrase